jgi:general secretion pathway protein A
LGEIDRVVTAPSQDDWENEVVAALGLTEPPFADLTSEAFFFPSEQHLRAMDFMRRVLCSRVSAGVITGAKGCGKSLLARSFIATLDDRFLVAHIQRHDLSPREFLLEILRQFGLALDKDDRTDRRMLLERYLMHQVGTGRICLLIVENAQAMHPAVLEELRYIAAIESDGNRLIKLILLGQPMLNLVVDSPRMQALVPPGIPRVTIPSLSEDQVHRLYAAGAKDPDKLIPHILMSAVHALSRGIPSEVNRLCTRALAVAASEDETVVTPACLLAAAEALGLQESFQVDLTEAGGGGHETEQAMLLISAPDIPENVVALKAHRMLIGRGELADITIDSAFVSRYHALIVREPGKDLLIDLGSTNGVLVNSKRVVRRILKHRDLVQIGPAKVVYLNPNRGEGAIEDPSATVAFARLGEAEMQNAVFAFGRFDEAG